MIDFMMQFPPMVQALLAGLFTYGMTALGAAGVFLSREIPKKSLNNMLGFSAGIMIAASFFSLLVPAIESTAEMGNTAPWIPAVSGFLLGGVFLWLIDKYLPHLHIGEKDPEGIRTGLSRNFLLVLAITLHNIPEGLAVGVAFGAAGVLNDPHYVATALSIAIGMGLQNFPEGLAVSAPLRAEGFSRGKAFFWGQFSGLVEPIGALLGAAAVIFIQPILPYALSFAAGAMMFVVSEELIPEAESDGSDMPTLALLVGLALMMGMDVALG